jgi:hypothetical protein
MREYNKLTMGVGRTSIEKPLPKLFILLIKPELPLSKEQLTQPVLEMEKPTPLS